MLVNFFFRYQILLRCSKHACRASYNFWRINHEYHQLGASFCLSQCNLDCCIICIHLSPIPPPQCSQCHWVMIDFPSRSSCKTPNQRSALGNAHSRFLSHKPRLWHENDKTQKQYNRQQRIEQQPREHAVFGTQQEMAGKGASGLEKLSHKLQSIENSQLHNYRFSNIYNTVQCYVNGRYHADLISHIKL